MRYILKNGKAVNIPDAEIRANMEVLEISQEEAVQMWLEDNEYEVNEEQTALNEKASKVKINLDVRSNEPGKTTKERIVKVSDEKKTLFESILTNIDRCEGVERENVTVLKENKLIEVRIGDKIFKIDLIEQRKKKQRRIFGGFYEKTAFFRDFFIIFSNFHKKIAIFFTFFYLTNAKKCDIMGEPQTLRCGSGSCQALISTNFQWTICAKLLLAIFL